MKKNVLFKPTRFAAAGLTFWERSMLSLGVRRFLGVSLICISLVAQSGLAYVTRETTSNATTSIEARNVRFEVNEFTFSSLDISPDGRWLVFDLLGSLYIVPIAGGQAKLLFAGNHWAYEPRFNSQSGELTFLMNDGSSNNSETTLWRMVVDLSKGAMAYRPEIALQSKVVDRLYVSADRHVYYDAYSQLHLQWDGESCKMSAVADDEPLPLRSLTYSEGGNYFIAAALGHAGKTSLWKIDPSDCNLERLDWDAASRSLSPQISPAGDNLAYVEVIDNRTVLRVRNLASGDDRALLDSAIPTDIHQRIVRSLGGRGTPRYAFRPDGRSIIILAAGKMMEVPLSGGAPREISIRVPVRKSYPSRPQASRRAPLPVLRWPSTSESGDTTIFGRRGIVWRLTDRGPVQLKTVGAAATFPVLSADGTQLIYLSGSGNGKTRIILQSIDGRSIREITPERQHSALAWSKDGQSIGYTEKYKSLSGTSKRRIGVIDTATGTETTLDVSDEPDTHLAPSAPIQFDAKDKSIYFYALVEDKATLMKWVRGENKAQRVKSLPLDQYVSFSPDGNSAVTVERFDLKASFPKAGGLSFGEARSILDAGSPPAVGPDIYWENSHVIRYVAGNSLCRRDLAEPKGYCQTLFGDDAGLKAGGSDLLVTGGQILVFSKGQSAGFVRKDLLIRKGRIKEIDDKLSVSGAVTKIDATGKYIVPGFIDTHWHNTEYHKDGSVDENTRSLFNYGVTTAFDPSSPIQAFSLSDRTNAPDAGTTRVVTTGPSLFELEIPDLATAEVIARGMAGHGAPFLKSYWLPSDREHRLLVEGARRGRLGVTIEGNTSMAGDLDQVVTDGATSFEHWGPTFPLRDDWINYLVRSGASITPTMTQVGREWIYSTADGHTHGGGAPPSSASPEFTEALKYAVQERNLAYEPLVEKWVTELGKLSAAGVPIDVGSHGTAAGLGFHWELWLLAKGLGNAGALKAGTLNGARKLNVMDKVGSIEVGKFGDLVILDKSPLEDIRNSTTISYIIRNGYSYPRK